MSTAKAIPLQAPFGQVIDPHAPYTRYLSELYALEPVRRANGRRDQGGSLSCLQHGRSKQRGAVSKVGDLKDKSAIWALAHKQQVECELVAKMLSLEVDHCVTGIIQESQIVLLDHHLQLVLSTLGRFMLLVDLKPSIWYWDSSSAIVERYNGRAVHQFIICIAATKSSRKQRLPEWMNEAAANRKAGVDASNSYGKPPPGLTIVELLVPDGYRDQTYLEGVLNWILRCLIRLTPDSEQCRSAADLRRLGYLPSVMMQDSDLAGVNAILLVFNGVNIAMFSSTMRDTLLANNEIEQLEAYVSLTQGNRFTIPAWCYRHHLKACYEYPLHASSLKSCSEQGYQTIDYHACAPPAEVTSDLALSSTISFEFVSVGGTTSGVDDGTQMPRQSKKPKTQTKIPSKRNRLSEAAAIWAQKFTWCRTEPRLIVLANVAAVVLCTSHFPASCVVTCKQDEVLGLLRAHHAKVEDLITAFSVPAPETYQDVVHLLRQVPDDDKCCSIIEE
jgi:hypothetical protein